MLPLSTVKLPPDAPATPETRKPLTQAAIEQAKPRDKVFRLWDSDGLYLEVSPTGGKWWRLKYRIAGKEKRISLGTYPEVSLAKARKRRNEARVKVADGIDPSAERQEEKRRAAAEALNSFEAVAREWHGRQARNHTERHSASVLRRLEADLFPKIGNKPIAEINGPMVLGAIREIEARGAHDLCRRVLIIASQVFRYGIATGRCAFDPAPALRDALTPHKVKHQPAVEPDEVPALMKAIGNYEDIGGERITKLGLQLLALTCIRTVELIEATWDEIRDLEGKEPRLEIPNARMKEGLAHIVPLPRQAVAILNDLKVLGCGSRYILPGRNIDKPMSNNTMLFALYRLGYKGRQTGHGLRAVASTWMNESGKWPVDVIERVLAHVESSGSRKPYNRAEYLKKRRKLLQWWADEIDRMISRAGAKVIPFKKTA